MSVKISYASILGPAKKDASSPMKSKSAGKNYHL